MPKSEKVGSDIGNFDIFILYGALVFNMAVMLKKLLKQQLEQRNKEKS